MLLQLFTLTYVHTDEALLALLERHRKLVSIVSLKGGEIATDSRRGDGAFRRVQTAPSHLSNLKLLFGVSLTVTTENRAEVMSFWVIHAG